MMVMMVLTDNREKYILVVDKGPANGLDKIMLTAKKEYAINFTEEQNKFV